MNYTNEIPPGTSFRMIGAPVGAVVHVATSISPKALPEQDIEIILPYDLRPAYGYAGKVVRFADLIAFLDNEGRALSRDRDLTLRHEARDERMIKEGLLYDRSMYADLPPQAREDLKTDSFGFDTNYILHLVADDHAEHDPQHAARLRYLADTYFGESDSEEPTEEELEEALEKVKQMLSR